jgi:hypothetical protein
LGLYMKFFSIVLVSRSPLSEKNSAVNLTPFQPMNLDETDMRILQLLQQNSQLTNKEIAGRNPPVDHARSRPHQKARARRASLRNT